MIRSLLLAGDEPTRRAEWRAYRSHTKKNVLWILPELVKQGARFLDDLRPTMEPDSDHPEVLEALKQVGFYTDAYGDKCNWSVPQKYLRPDFAKSLVAIAHRLSDRDEAMTTAEELKLWVKHLKPVWKGPMWEMSQALAACYAETEALGVLRHGESAQDMTRFLFRIEPEQPEDRR